MPACVNCRRYVCCCVASPRVIIPRRKVVAVSTPKLSVATSVSRELAAVGSRSSPSSPRPSSVVQPVRSVTPPGAVEVVEGVRSLFDSLESSECSATVLGVSSRSLLTESAPFDTSFTMTYVNFSVKHRLLVAQGWCSFSDFCQFVADHQFLGFHIVANRNRVREAYARLRGPAPFSSTARFPDDFFVALGGPLRSYFEQLLCAIDLPDRALERSGQNDFGINSLSDAKRSYDVAFQRLATIAVEFDVGKLAAQGVYCRETFESTYALEWRD